MYAVTKTELIKINIDSLFNNTHWHPNNVLNALKFFNEVAFKNAKS